MSWTYSTVNHIIVLLNKTTFLWSTHLRRDDCALFRYTPKPRFNSEHIIKSEQDNSDIWPPLLQVDLIKIEERLCASLFYVQLKIDVYLHSFLIIAIYIYIYFKKSLHNSWNISENKSILLGTKLTDQERRPRNQIYFNVNEESNEIKTMILTPFWHGSLPLTYQTLGINCFEQG